ncbi:MAG: hypothetical protein ACYC7A_02920 [Thermoanaerobaculia bacterium]
MRNAIAFVFTLLVMLPAMAFGQGFEAFERILLPIVVSGEPMPGAHGSLWMTFVAAHNAGTTAYMIKPGRSGSADGGSWYIEAGASATFRPNTLLDGQPVFLYVRAVDGANEFVHLQLRAQDLSRQALTWGTEIPVIREDDVLTGGAQLLAVPTDSRFRLALRVIDFDFVANRTVHYRIFNFASGALLAEGDIALTTAAAAEYREFTPGWGGCLDLTGAFPQLRAAETVRIELTAQAGIRYWAYVSVTNNETQHITLITPEKLGPALQ